MLKFLGLAEDNEVNKNMATLPREASHTDLKIYKLPISMYNLTSTNNVSTKTPSGIDDYRVSRRTHEKELSPKMNIFLECFSATLEYFVVVFVVVDG